MNENLECKYYSQTMLASLFSTDINKYIKGAIYSSGIALAALGYLLKNHIHQKRSKVSVVFQIYYPLFLQYPAALDLYFGFI